MNELLLSNAIIEYAETLAAIRRSNEWKREHEKFHDYTARRWGLSRTRTKLLLDFVALRTLTQDKKLTPETPEQIAPVTRLPRKKWLDAWEVLEAYCEPGFNHKEASILLEQYGLTKRPPPKRVRDQRRIRTATRAFADMEDGTDLVDRLGKNVLGRDWEKAVEVVIDADQRRLETSR